MAYDGDMLCLLRGWYGPAVEWRCNKQRDAVTSLMALKTDVVLALGCGVRKTAVIVLPSLVKNGYTVVVIPLLSLLADWKQRCSKAGIPYEVWEGFKTDKLVGNCNLILATTDTAQGQQWETALMSLPQPVLRVVVEEAHQHATEISFRGQAFSDSYCL